MHKKKQGFNDLTAQHLCNSCIDLFRLCDLPERESLDKDSDALSAGANFIANALVGLNAPNLKYRMSMR